MITSEGSGVGPANKAVPQTVIDKIVAIPFPVFPAVYAMARLPRSLIFRPGKIVITAKRMTVRAMRLSKS